MRKPTTRKFQNLYFPNIVYLTVGDVAGGRRHEITDAASRQNNTGAPNKKISATGDATSYPYQKRVYSVVQRIKSENVRLGANYR
jgi:hypothetical protein